MAWLRRANRRIARGVIGSAAGVALATAASAQTPVARYEIHFHRPAHAGQTTHFTVEGSVRQTARVIMPGRPVQETAQHLTLHLRAVESVVTVDAHGDAVRSDYTIERFETEDDHGSHTWARPGQVLVVVRAPRLADVVATIDGHPLDPVAKDALVRGVRLTAGHTDEDVSFGVVSPQHVGDRWPMHLDGYQGDLARASGVVSALVGETQLAGRRRFEQVDCLDLRGAFHGRVTQLPGLPANAVLRDGTIQATASALFPLDPTLPRLADDTHLEMVAVADLPGQGGPGELQVSFEQDAHETVEATP